MSERPKCLNCGKPLREEMRSFERLATPQEIAALEARKEKLEAMREARDAARNDGEWSALDALYQREQNKRHRSIWNYPNGATISDRESTGRFGQDGLGLFCKRACGEAFGVSAARAGFRRVTK